MSDAPQAQRDPLAPQHIQALRPYVPGKPVAELAREQGVEDAVKLASNENPVGPSPLALAAARDAAADVNRYPDAAHYELRRALSQFLEVDPAELVIGSGSNELIDLLCRTLAGAGDHAVYPVPSFVCYGLCTQAAALRTTAVPLRDFVHYEVDALLDAVKPETRLVFVANPNNPTGTYLPGEELRRLLRELPSNVTAVIDEAYLELCDAEDYEHALGMRELHERTVILRTFSKAYGLAGLRVGYAICTSEIADYLNRVRAPFNVNSVAQAAAIAALKDQDHVKAYVALNARERERVTVALRELGLTVAPSQTNFVLVDFARPGADVYATLLKQGVIVRPMPAPIETWQRISIGLPFENDRMLGAVRQLLEG